MGFLRQNIKITNERLKNAAYKTSLQPVPEYASPVWDPFTANNIKALEKVQKTTKDQCVDTMWKQLHWPTLGQHRKQACLTTVYKFHHGLIHIESKHCPSSTNCPRRTTQHIYIYIYTHDLTYDIPFHRTAYIQKTFFPSTITQWNSLLQEGSTAPISGSIVTRVCSFLDL